MRKLLFVAMLFLLLSITAIAQAQDWMEVTPGGGAVCARGTPYTFFVRAGDPKKLLIFFEGGGACWNDETCAPNSGLFDEVVEGGEANAYNQGILATANPENPLAGYTTIFVTYCTGDYHLGTKEVTYSNGTVEHKGSVDATAALNWTFANYKAPSDIVIAGCSAGAIGSIYYAPTVARHYRSARLTQFGDAGVGVINPDWGGFDVWGVKNRRASPDQYIASLYTGASRSYPRDRFGEYTTYNDSTQTNYYVLTGAVMAWPLAMEASLAGLQKRSNFHSFVGAGSEHCVTTSDRFYSEAVDGLRFRDWFAALVAGAPVDNVKCSVC
ncbi:MAG: hypothetical protein GC204_13510 [Chloroflexi bacterium]|nr:hypothetical protein [Chloroflexota bacterium]